MTKGSSESVFGAALRGLDADLPIVVYKPPDDARNRKPCDFMVWWRGDLPGALGLKVDNEILTRVVRPAWFEVKDVDTVRGFNVNELRPSQKAGIREAGALGLPYYLAVYWASLHSWTIGPAYKILEHAVQAGNTVVPVTLMGSVLGIQSSPANLGSTLKDVLNGEFD